MVSLLIILFNMFIFDATALLYVVKNKLSFVPDSWKDVFHRAVF